jgi:hypothetical protein
MNQQRPIWSLQTGHAFVKYNSSSGLHGVTMKWNHEWPEGEYCPNCSGVISSRRVRNCGRCGAALHRENQLSFAATISIEDELAKIEKERLARRREETRKRRKRRRARINGGLALSLVGGVGSDW